MAKITIDQLQLAIGLDGTEFVPIAKNTGPGYVTEKTTVGALVNGGIEATYVVANDDFVLPNARILAGESGQTTVTDNGAGSTLVVGLADTTVTPGIYGDSTHLVRITIDATGRITSASQIDLSLSFQSYLQGLPTSLPSQPNIPWNNGGIVSLS
ncbi:hypothetical protein [Rhizobium lusitanum]|uniref:hypothetical protein n=1 Tax=Rhizobium lusitanum TaxID=293958 RepID=UPI00195975ED|nr:hypothetical protein [Rhizobium lusitanum]MBM7047585.1 hypothetical protein [Rhizobium lusitanum]